jgi:hypothetical protein
VKLNLDFLLKKILFSFWFCLDLKKSRDNDIMQLWKIEFTKNKKKKVSLR